MMADTGAQLPVFPFDMPISDDFNQLYAEYREQCPVPKVRLKTGGDAYLVTRYHDARRVLADPAFSRSACMDPEVKLLLNGIRRPELLINIDGPEHTRQHRLTVHAFTGKAVERCRPLVQKIADELVDRMVEAGPPLDFIEYFGTPFPNRVIFEIFGVPTEDYDLLVEWLTRLLSFNRHSAEQQAAAFTEATGYFARLIERKRAEPGEDLTSALIQSEDGNDRFTTEELVRIIWVNVSGGTTAASSILSNALVTFARNPEQWERLRDDPDLVPQAVEEILRYVATGNTSFERLAVQDVELSGTLIPAGSVVIPLLGSGNVDSAAYQNPHVFDIDRFANVRSESPHLGYGHGIHRCVGSPLANVELQIAFRTLLERLPNLRLAVPVDELEWERGVAMRRMVRTPVTW
jgi:cytochrome P450